MPRLHSANLTASDVGSCAVLFVLALSMIWLQSAHAEPPTSVDSSIRIGVVAPYFVQPGLRAGGHFALTEDTVERNRRQRPRLITRRIFVGPRLTWFTRINDHQSVALDVELGLSRMRNQSRLTSSFSLSLGYMRSAHITDLSVELGTGDVDRQWQARNHLLALFNYSIARNYERRTGWYAGLSFGRRMSYETADSAFFSIEAGVTLRIGPGGSR